MLAIKAENISKQYRLGQVGTGTLSHDLHRFWCQVRGKEDPYLKIGEANDRSVKGESEYVWSLRDINFEIEQGDAVGIIGRNGAGKSTLLKILSKVTKPTTGKIQTKGRIASLLEVGTGFHPEMTGRENIFLNGAILGMTRREITRKFDEIVDFSGVERYIDTPVKRYSSGMYVRLAFAVAAHLESEILIVDEVLAVGDAEFQKKCLGKMDDVSKGEGRTVLFVSHNLSSITKFCDTTFLLKQGSIVESGNTSEVINSYLKQENDKFLKNIKAFEIPNTSVRISDFGFYQHEKKVMILHQGEDWAYEFTLENHSDSALEILFNIELKTPEGVPVTFFGNEFQNLPITLKPKEKKRMVSFLNQPHVRKGDYYISVYFLARKNAFQEDFAYYEDVSSVKVSEPHTHYFTDENRFWDHFSVNNKHGNAGIAIHEIKEKQ